MVHRDQSRAIVRQYTEDWAEADSTLTDSLCFQGNEDESDGKSTERGKKVEFPVRASSASPPLLLSLSLSLLYSTLFAFCTFSIMALSTEYLG